MSFMHEDISYMKQIETDLETVALGLSEVTGFISDQENYMCYSHAEKVFDAGGIPQAYKMSTYIQNYFVGSRQVLIKPPQETKNFNWNMVYIFAICFLVGIAVISLLASFMRGLGPRRRRRV